MGDMVQNPRAIWTGDMAGMAKNTRAIWKQGKGDMAKNARAIWKQGKGDMAKNARAIWKGDMGDMAEREPHRRETSARLELPKDGNNIPQHETSDTQRQQASLVYPHLFWNVSSC